MDHMASNVRITPGANTLLSALALKTGKPKAQIVEEALRDLEDRMFWTEVQSSFATAPDELRSETELWEGTVSDGLRGIVGNNETW